VPKSAAYFFCAEAVSNPSSNLEHADPRLLVLGTSYSTYFFTPHLHRHTSQLLRQVELPASVLDIIVEVRMNVILDKPRTDQDSQNCRNCQRRTSVSLSHAISSLLFTRYDAKMPPKPINWPLYAKMVAA